MTEDYQARVLQEYKKLKETGRLTCDLSTRAKFRKECIKAFNKKYNSQDDDVFADFFEVDKLEANFHQLLNKSEADDFKAVHNHIAGYNKTDNTEMKNTELIAWFIDFQPRPSTLFYKKQRETETKEEFGRTLVTAQTEDGANKKQGDGPEQTPDVTPTKLGFSKYTIPKKYYKSIFAFGTAAAVAIGAFIFYPKNYQCMYWTGDHYVGIACDQKASSPVIALDTFKISNLKKIDKRDTLTAASIGKVHYAKVKVDSVDFYTSGGDHPTNSTKRLLPLTQYILTKYVANKK